MDVQFTENKLIELFIEVDDLHKAFIVYQSSKGVRPKTVTRAPQLAGSEVCTILVAYHYSGYKCFEYYYKQLILGGYSHYFPVAPTYERFVSLIPRAADLIYLWLLYTIGGSKKTGMYFIDSKKLEVCHLKREHSNKVFEGVATKGKTSTGWFFGLKLHLVINNLGQIMACDLTPGNVADNNHEQLKKLLNALDGYCVGDKGYHSALFDFFFVNGLRLITKPKKNMKKFPIDNKFNLLINKRAVIESVFDILGTICDVEHTRHRSPLNAAIHIYSALIAYQYLEEKPQVFFPSISQKLQLAA